MRISQKHLRCWAKEILLTIGSLKDIINVLINQILPH